MEILWIKFCMDCYLILDHQSKTLGLENMADVYEDLSHVVGSGGVERSPHVTFMIPGIFKYI